MSCICPCACPCDRYSEASAPGSRGAAHCLEPPHAHRCAAGRLSVHVGASCAVLTHFAAAIKKIAPALATGNSIILKPSELAPVSVLEVSGGYGMAMCKGTLFSVL